MRQEKWYNSVKHFQHGQAQDRSQDYKLFYQQVILRFDIKVLIKLNPKPKEHSCTSLVATKTLISLYQKLSLFCFTHATNPFWVVVFEHQYPQLLKAEKINKLQRSYQIRLTFYSGAKLGFDSPAPAVAQFPNTHIHTH